MKAHPAAELFPMLDGEEFEAFKADIERNGQIDQIVLHEDQILDGRNRWRACAELGVLPMTRLWAGECGSPAAFVVSVNIKRRHLNTGQRALIGVELEKHIAEEIAAKERERKAAQPREGGQFAAPTGADLPQSVGGGDEEVRAPRATDIAAKAVGVSGRAQRQAKRVKAKAPDLADKVKAGDVALDAAERELKKREREEAAALNAKARALSDAEAQEEVRRAEVTARWSKALNVIMSGIAFDPDIGVPCLPPDSRAHTERVLDQMDSWIARTRAALRTAQQQQLRIVGG